MLEEDPLIFLINPSGCFTDYGVRTRVFSSSSPSISSIADFLVFLFDVKKFSLPLSRLIVPCCQPFTNSNSLLLGPIPL